MENLKLDGKVDHLSYGFSSRNVLSYVTWSFETSKNWFKCIYMLSFAFHTIWKLIIEAFIIYDCRYWGKNISVLFNLGLSENAEQRSRLLFEWNTAFDTQLPEVMFTDVDEAKSSAIKAYPSGESIYHLLCVCHLFDRNTKGNMSNLLFKLQTVQICGSITSFIRNLPSCWIWETVWHSVE